MIYWFLLLYIIAALVWWYIALNQQNQKMMDLKLNEIKREDVNYNESVFRIQKERDRKTAQYAGEGAIFFLLIVAGAVFVYRTVNRELKIGQEQRHFIMAVTHELKTPIAVAKLNLETLQLRKLNEAQQERLLYNTLQETNRLNTLCNNMLISSQIDAGGYRITNEEINISQLAQNCVNDFSRRFPQRPFVFSCTNDLFVSGDMLLLQMAINNLLDNAIKYSGKEDTIEIEIVQLISKLQIRIKDHGVGIELQERKKIFEKLYRIGNEATRNSKGTGLGLYLTKKIINSHKGRIFLQDNDPKGTIFIIELDQVA
ncbi:MAG: ATP-binding protein [Ferruginibacter sp.]